MIVKCKPLNSEVSKNYDNWITEGKDYPILSIFYDERKMFFYRIIGNDEKTPALYESHLFKVISSVIPTNWTLDFDGTIFQLSPKPWLASEFWERYFDGDKDALNIFEKELQIILTAK